MATVESASVENQIYDIKFNDIPRTCTVFPLEHHELIFPNNLHHGGGGGDWTWSSTHGLGRGVGQKRGPDQTWTIHELHILGIQGDLLTTRMLYKM